MPDVKFIVDHLGLGTLSVDGIELQNVVRGFELKSRAGEPSKLVLDIPPGVIDGQVSIELGKIGITIDGTPTCGATRMIELNWDNLRKLFVWAAKQDSADQPYVDDGDQSITIDGSLDRKVVEAFLDELEPPV